MYKMNYTKGTPEMAQELYKRILQTANHFLHSAKRYEISVLQDYNPSFEELSEIMKDMATIIRGLADEIDPMLGTKALDYAQIMSTMALAITNNDDVSLQEQIVELDKKPFC